MERQRLAANRVCSLKVGSCQIIWGERPGAVSPSALSIILLEGGEDG
jgi:hypothetical protein